MTTFPSHRHLRTRRRRRRARRQEGAVLFLVLMVVALSTLAATFAVQDTTYAMRGSRGVRQAISARYAAESGISSVPSLLQNTAAGSVHLLLRQNAERGNTETVPYEKFPVPKPIGSSAYWHTNHDEVHLLAFPAAPDTRPLWPDDSTASSEEEMLYARRYEVIYESLCGDGMLNVTSSAYGRESLGWDGEKYSSEVGFQQTDDPNHYHDTVSLARGYYTSDINNCPTR